MKEWKIKREAEGERVKKQDLGLVGRSILQGVPLVNSPCERDRDEGRFRL